MTDFSAKSSFTVIMIFRSARSRRKKRSTEEAFEMEEVQPGSGEENIAVEKEDGRAKTHLTKKAINADDPKRTKNVLGVFVHQSDCLKLDLHVLHPVVKVIPC